MNKIIERITGLSSTNKNVLVNMLGAFLVKGLSLGISLLTMPAYIRYFQNQTVLGIWYTIISVLNWVLFFDLGLGNGLRNILPEAIAKNDHKRIREAISTTYFSMSGFTIVFILAGCFIIPQLDWNSILNVNMSLVDNSVLIECILIIFIGIMFQFILKLVTSVLYALQKSALVNFMTLCSTAITLIALYILPSSSLYENLIWMSVINVVAMTLPYAVMSAVVYGIMLKNSTPSLRYFNKEYVNPILKIGLSLLWLQFVFMIISSTNEFLITYLTLPDYVVDYQAYYKVFKTGVMVVSLALTPIWSAVTKAKAIKDYNWIIRIYKLFLWATLGCLAVEFCILPVLQPFMNIWLGKGVIEVETGYAIAFIFSSSIFVLHNVNTSIGNGISYFKTQMIWMTFAAIVDVPLSYVFVKLTGSWIGVVIANILALVPYEFIAPVCTFKVLKRMSSESKGNKEKELKIST